VATSNRQFAICSSDFLDRLGLKEGVY